MPEDLIARAKIAHERVTRAHEEYLAASEEYRQAVVEAAETHGASAVAKELGIHRQRIYQLRRNHAAKSVQGGQSPPEPE